jgi:flagella basal body P-ring formation protein FlgA
MIDSFKMAFSVFVVSFVLSPMSIAAPAAKDQNFLDRKFRSAVVSELVRRYGIPESQFDVEVQGLRTLPAWKPETSAQIEIAGLESVTRLDGLVAAQLLVRGVSPVVSGDYQVQAQVRVRGPVLTTQGSLRRGQVLQQEDIVQSRIPWRNLPSSAFGLKSQDVIGKSLRLSLGAGENLNRDFLENPPEVRSGELVEITILSGPGVIIRSRGVAKQEGRAGDWIRVEQPESRKSVSAQVLGRRQVELRL